MTVTESHLLWKVRDDERVVDYFGVKGVFRDLSEGTPSGCIPITKTTVGERHHHFMDAAKFPDE